MRDNRMSYSVVSFFFHVALIEIMLSGYELQFITEISRAVKLYENVFHFYVGNNFRINTARAFFNICMEYHSA